jgi:hypothetical protein
MKEDPGYTHMDDVYFYLGESFVKGSPGNNVAARAQAVTYFDRLVKEFEASEHLEEARKRLAELNAANTGQDLKAQ